LKLKRCGRSRWFAWWYFCISLGFLLLAIHFYLRGGGPGTFALRLVISISFAVLGYMQLKMASD